MSDCERAANLFSEIVGAKDIIHKCFEIYNTVGNKSTIPQASRKVFDKLPLVEELLKSANAYVDRCDDQYADQYAGQYLRSVDFWRRWSRASSAAEECKALCQELHDLLLNACPKADVDEAGRLWTSMMEVLSDKGNSAEVLWQEILGRLDILAKVHFIKDDAIFEDIKLSVYEVGPKNRYNLCSDHRYTECEDNASISVAKLAVNAKFYTKRIEEGHLRILTVKPGSHFDPVLCELEELRTDSVPQYDPISYCWTHDTEFVCITVNDMSDFKIPAHLLSCLQRIRDVRSEKRVWLDAVCINQADELEKSAQVRQMPKIYGGGYQTLIWLGETESGVPSCIIRAAGFCATQGFSSIEHGNMLELMGKFAQDAEEISLNSDERYFMRVWWRRLWCLQEFMLSPRTPKVMIGPHLIAWKDFCAATRQYKIEGLSLMRTISGCGLNFDNWNPQRHKKSLLELLKATSKTFTCVDPRDRIFALLGLVDDATLPLQANYFQTAEEVYVEAVMYLIKTESSVDVITDHRASRSDSSFPTWIPDFGSLKNSKEARTLD